MKNKTILAAAAAVAFVLTGCVSTMKPNLPPVTDYTALLKHIDAHPGRVGLLSMQASDTAEKLAEDCPDRLAALYGPEHGFFGVGGGGEKIAKMEHPRWHIPVHSLYGEHRAPTPEMLADIDWLVIDLCDLGVRCFTYLATLELTLTECAKVNMPVVVLDRPVPNMGVYDGPMLTAEADAAGLRSFVSPVNVPLSYGMTQGEAAQWIVREKNLKIDLTVIRSPWAAQFGASPWPGFLPPSPAIRSWDCGAFYVMTMFTEAYTAIDCDRSGTLAFRLVGAPWLDATRCVDELQADLVMCGVTARPWRYTPRGGAYEGKIIDGVLFSRTMDDAIAFRPVEAGLTVFAWLLKNYPEEVAKGARDAWLDKIFTTSDLKGKLLSDSASFFAECAAAREAYKPVKLY